MGARLSIWRNLPWCDPAGRVSPVKLAMFVLLWLPAAWMASNVGTLDWTFPSPYVPLIYHSGLWATYLLLLSLAVTPARRILNWSRAAQLRRMIGVAAFGYTLLHVFSWLGLRFFDWITLLAELAVRPSLWIASIATLGLLALAATSIDAAMRQLGPLWKKLHRTVYVLAFLAVLHFLMSPGSLQGGPFLMAALYVWLMGWRLLERRGLGTNLAALALLGAGASAFALLIEPIWLATFQQERWTTGTSEVLAANFDLDRWRYLGIPPVVSMLTLTVLSLLAVGPWRAIYSRWKYQLRGTS